MTYRHRHPEPKSGAAVAVGLVLVLIAGGVLYGVYRWVKRHDAAPAAVVVDEVGLQPAEAPFDNVFIDPVTNAFVMVVEVGPDADSGQRVVGAVSDCLSFRADAGFYPEAAGREHVVRVLFRSPPDPRLLARLPLERVQVWVEGADRRERLLGDADLKRALEALRPGAADPDVESETPAPVRIDMMSKNPDTGATVLVLVQDEPWRDDVTEGVRRRVDDYFRAAESGALEIGESYEIHVRCRERPGSAAVARLARTFRVLKSEGVPLRLFVVGAGGEEEIPLAR